MSYCQTVNKVFFLMSFDDLTTSTLDVVWDVTQIRSCYDTAVSTEVFCDNDETNDTRVVEFTLVENCYTACDPECSITSLTVSSDSIGIPFTINPVSGGSTAYPSNAGWKQIWDLLANTVSLQPNSNIFPLENTINSFDFIDNLVSSLATKIPNLILNCSSPSDPKTCRTCDDPLIAEANASQGSVAISTQTVDRNNRPSVDSRVALKVFFMNDGEYIDPTEIVDVTIFDRSSMQNPSTILGADGLLKGEVASGLAKAYFKSPILPGWQDISEYVAGDLGSSGVYRVRQGEYIVVLDGVTNIPGLHPIWGNVINNTASATGDYIDVWTVKYPAASLPKVVINSFSLFNDTFYNLTEPLLIKSHNELITKKVVLGSKQDIKITTEFTVENKNINSSIRNLFKTAVAINPKIKIEKINQDPNLPGRTTIVDFTDEQDIRVTSQNTFIYNWNTEQLRYHASIAAGTISGLRGIYAVTLKYNLLNETIVAPQMYVQLV